MQHLVVVESPAKSKTVARFLKGTGRETSLPDAQEYQILATGGHIYQSDYVDVDNDFELRYELIPEKKKNVDGMVTAMRNAQSLYLATDPDREGEAIAAHVEDILRKRGALKNKPVYRVVFHEVTKDAVRNAIADPGKVSNELVQAQKSRDALDYLVGFNLSPLLIRKLNTPHLSAGRVQSPALRLIVERQREIQAFQPQEYWTIKAILHLPALDNESNVETFEAGLTHLDGKKLGKLDIPDEGSVKDAIATINSDLPRTSGQQEMAVLSVESKKRASRPSPPFTTSTLVQEAARKLGMSARITASTAQKLYEGLTVNGTQTGLITYTRTDSVTLSRQATNQIRNYVKERFGDNQLPGNPRLYKTKSKNAQEAHEAIRPTNIFLTPDKVASSLNADQLRLYRIIWNRTVASQMNDAIYDNVNVVLGTEQNKFRASGSKLRVAGWLAVYSRDDVQRSDETDKRLPPLTQGDRVHVQNIVPQQHFTQPPARYNTASLIGQLEEYGIGRPSTWPTIISKLLERNYVEMSKQSFIASSLGCVVVDYLMQHFNQYVDYEFTSNLEDGLDAVARGETKRTQLLGSFWREFHAHVQENQSAQRFEILLGTDAESNRDLLVRIKKGGSFIQLGRMSDEQGKPRFFSLPAGVDPGTVTLDTALELLRKPPLPRTLGTAEDGREIEVSTGRFGPYFSIKTADGQTERTSLDKSLDPYAITLEEAILFLAQPRLPRTIGLTPEGSEVVARSGRFGPYLSVVSKDGTKSNVSIPKTDDPMSITLERSQQLIEGAKDRFSNRRKVIRQFENSSIQILDGRYGPYATDGKVNATVPKGMEPSELGLEFCQELIAKKAARKPAKRKRKSPTRRPRAEN
ncbi:MAG: type I DNA topoisomerase [Acidiferrobacterales bacterium]|nr:type I DNA topoisomerase [Acidiferrobacterales bacterium]